MTVGGAGEPGAMLAGFRALLERAEGDDGARSEALDSLLARSMQAATWSGKGEALRTLRNEQGEQALGLWSGEDTLAAAAAQLGWAGEGGAVSTRSVDAREAIEAALAQGVSFVVIDLGSAHALELAGDELSLLLALKQKLAPKASTAAQTPKAKAAKGLVDFDLPFVHGRAEPAADGATAARHESVADAGADVLARAFAAAVDDGPGSKKDAPQEPPKVALPSPPLVAQAQAQAQTAAGEPGNAKGSVGAKPRTMIGQPAPAVPAAAPAPPKPPASEEKVAPARAPKPSEEKPSAIKSAARAFKTMIGTGEVAPEASSAEPAEGAEPATYPDGALRPLELGLSEGALAAIAEALRGYPEVEWACEVSDGTEVPVIGLRVSQQFMTRAAEIEQAALGAGTARGAELRVLMLNDAAVMREARTHGRAFYPWKKRR